MRNIAFLLISAYLAIAQSVAIGVEGGIRTSGDVTGDLTPESKRYIVGPKIEVRLPWHLSFEFDALYRRIGFTEYYNGPCCESSVTRERLNSWEFPMLVKYRLPGLLRMHPFVGLGPAPRILHGSSAVSGSYQNVATGANTYFSGKNSISYPVTQGFVVSGGLEFGAHHVLISPELRYVHWNADFLTDFGPEGPGYYYPNSVPQNELYMLVGIAWH